MPTRGAHEEPREGLEARVASRPPADASAAVPHRLATGGDVDVRAQRASESDHLGVVRRVRLGRGGSGGDHHGSEEKSQSSHVLVPSEDSTAA